jgi:metal-sulfur cluster biosynthetic enzyme
MEKKMVRLTYEDCFVMEIVANRINAIMDEVEAIEEELHGRLDALWKYGRIKKEEQDKRFQAIEKELTRYRPRFGNSKVRNGETAETDKSEMEVKHGETEETCKIE